VEISSQSSLKVLVIEKERPGFNHTTPAVLAQSIHGHGLEDAILQGYSGFIHDSPSGIAANIDFGRIVYASIGYEKACKILLTRAITRGVRLITAHVLEWLPKHPDPKQRITLKLEKNDQIETDMIIDASGHSQLAARVLGIRRSNYYSHCFGEYLSGCSSDAQSFFRFLRPTKNYGNGGGWFYPTGKAAASIGYSIVSHSPVGKDPMLSEGYFRAKTEFEPYSTWVKKGKRERIESGTVPVGRIGRFYANRILIVGDAAGQAHPWVVEGCRPALDYGRLSAKVAVSAFEQNRFDKEYLSRYEREWNKTNRERFWRAASIAELQWNRTDEQWDKLLIAMNKVSPEKVLVAMRDNYASTFHKVYAVAGYLRRGLAKRIFLHSIC